MAADKKSNPAQIAQAVLDEPNQSVKVTVVNTDPVPVDIQDTEIAIAIDKDEDSVTIYTPNNNTTPIPVAVTDVPAPLDVVGTGAASEALRVHLSNESLAAFENISVTVGNVEITDPSTDILGVNVTGKRNNQVEINFSSAPGASLITETFTGGGSVSVTNGHSIYSTGTGTTASARVVTVQNVVYRPANEIYAYFTAAFTPGVANSFQRIGLFDTNNGFFIGYEGTIFGITKRTSGVDTFTARTSWSGDLLTGGISSKFTRNGTPEAINLAFSNLFRIRFAWLGSASVIFEVFTPDGTWLMFHTLKIPNSQYDPSVSTPNLPISLHLSKTTAGATNLSIATACWAGGTTSDYVKISDTLTENTLASLSRSVITGQTTAGGGGFVNVKVNPSGALNVAATQDGTWNINNVTGTVSLPTGASTLAAQNTGNASLSSIDGKTPALGQATMAASSPVVIASNQSAVPVSGSVTVSQATAANLNATVTGTVAATQSGTWNINNVSGTVSLPTGASTLAAQNTGNTSLSSIDTKTPALGQAVMASSRPVVLASNHTPILVYTQPLATYAAGITDLLPAATNGISDIVTISGSASKTIKIRKIHVSGALTAGGDSIQLDLFLIRRDAADTGGTSTVITPVRYDSANPAATNEIRAYTAAPTINNTVGSISQSMLFVSRINTVQSAGPMGGNFVEIDFVDSTMQPLTLRTATQFLTIALRTPATWTVQPNLEIDIVWTEE